jgi:hypothetical protein
MRTMLKFEFGLAETNEAVQTGTVDAINAQLMDTTKPEAAYFGTENADDLQRGLAAAATG